jgi:hypothetical protein
MRFGYAASASDWMTLEARHQAAIDKGFALSSLRWDAENIDAQAVKCDYYWVTSRNLCGHLRKKKRTQHLISRHYTV